MLIDHPIAVSKDRVTDLVAADNGNPAEPRKLDKGIYERGDFSISAVHHTILIDENPRLVGGNCFGVCDNYQQVVESLPELIHSPRSFFVTVTPVKREADDEENGWRWQQWGPYIGNREPQTDYLVNEPDIDSVFVYHVYEVISQNTLH